MQETRCLHGGAGNSPAVSHYWSPRPWHPKRHQLWLLLRGQSSQGRVPEARAKREIASSLRHASRAKAPCCSVRHAVSARRPMRELQSTSRSPELIVASPVTASCRAVRPPLTSAGRPCAQCICSTPHEPIAALQVMASTPYRPRGPVPVHLRNRPPKDPIPTRRARASRRMMTSVMMPAGPAN